MKPTVIIVDDVAHIREQLRVTLTKEFNVIAEARDGAEAVELIQHHQPDLVTMDVVMPRLSGIDAVQKVCGKSESPAVVMLSGITEENTVLRALEAGASDYLFKPIEKDKLVGILKRVFDQRRTPK